MMMMMMMMKQYSNNVVLLWLIMVCILFHSYESSDLIIGRLDENNNNYDDFDKKIWYHKNNYDDDMLINFFDNVNVTIYCNNNNDYIADTSFCNPIDHNVTSSSSLSASSSNVSVENKCNLRSAWHTCRLMFNNISCMIILPEDDMIFMDIH